MAEITTSSSESKTLQETVMVDGKSAYMLNASLSGSRAGGFSINGNPVSQDLYQDNKDEIEPAIQDFVTNVLNQAEAQDGTATTETSEDASEEAEDVSATAKTKAKK